jgi:4-amino-4-deoxy-L-arabinose transferase-like glycosyltransferase
MTAKGRLLEWALLMLLFLIPCGAVGVVDPTEARYAEIAREMVASRDFLVPRLDGLPHLAKPPGAYWAIAPSVAALGPNEWGARLSVVLAGLLVLGLTGRLARLLGREPSLPIWILAATPLFFVLFHLASADAFLAAAVAGFHAAYLDPRRRDGLLPFVALAAGFLIKGPVVLVSTVMPVLAAAWWTRRGDVLAPLARLRGWAVFAILALPWYIYVLGREPGLPAYFLHETWDRFTTTAQHRAGAPTYFLLLLVLGALPWTPFVLRGLARRVAGARARGDFEVTAVAAWVAFPLVFFTASSSKLPGYVLPVVPALALAAGWGLGGGRAARTVAVALVVVFAVVPWFLADVRAGSVRPVARYLMERDVRPSHVYECGPFFAGLPFYLRGTVGLLDVQRDTLFATPAEKANAFRTMPPAWMLTSGPFWIFGDETLARRRIAEAGLSGQVEMRWRQWVLLKAVPSDRRLYRKGT